MCLFYYIHIKRIVVFDNMYILYQKYVYNKRVLNPLNAELNPICHLLALIGAHHILHVSRVRVKFIRIFLGCRECTRWVTMVSSMSPRGYDLCSVLICGEQLYHGWCYTLIRAVDGDTETTGIKMSPASIVKNIVMLCLLNVCLSYEYCEYSR